MMPRPTTVLWLRRFIPRLQQQLNVVNGLVAVGALLLALAGLITGGLLRTLLFAAGVVLAVVMIAIAAVKAWPPKMKSPRDVEGQELPIADLEAINPRVPALGIVGVGNVGKTTVKARLLQKPMPDEPTQTQRITVHVSSLLRDPATYFAMIDGRGGALWQQGQIADHSDILLVLLDHDDIAGTGPNEDRLRAHEQFGQQLRDWLTNQSQWRGPVHVILNKKDLWQQADDNAKEQLARFFADEVERWRIAFGDRVTSAQHSNDSPDDIARLIEVIGHQRQELPQWNKR